MHKQTINTKQYYLIAQDSNGLLEIGIRGQTLRLRRTAKEVLADSKLLNGFSITEKALINNISKTENNKISNFTRKK